MWAGVLDSSDHFHSSSARLAELRTGQEVIAEEEEILAQT